MDAATKTMLAQAYDETVGESLGQGHDAATAHKEGITAAAMFLASMSGADDAAARTEVEKLGFKVSKE
jgi:hypothetical protein